MTVFGNIMKVKKKGEILREVRKIARIAV